MNGADAAVVNLDHALHAVQGRLLPGAQILMLGSLWAPFGPVYDTIQKHWAKPSGDVLVIRGTGPTLNPTYWTPKRCNDLKRRNPNAYRTDVLCEFADPESGLLSPVAIDAAVRPAPLELPFDPSAFYCAAVDPSGGGAKGNAASLVIVKTEHTDDGPRYRVALAREWQGLDPEGYMAEMAACCHRFGLRAATTDAYAPGLVVALSKRHGLNLVPRPGMLDRDGLDFAALLHGGRGELSPGPQLKADLLGARRQVTQKGEKVVLPRTSDGRHADYFPAVAAAVAVGEWWAREHAEGADAGGRVLIFGHDGVADLTPDEPGPAEPEHDDLAAPHLQDADEAFFARLDAQRAAESKDAAE